MSKPARILLALVAGLVLGAALHAYAPALGERAERIAEPVGGMWLDALRMTIVPLVVSLLITGIASTASAARAGGVAARTVVLILACLWTSAVIGYLATTGILTLWPMPEAAGAALRAALGAQEQAVPETPGIGEFLRSIVPANPIRAAAEDQMLSIVLFAGVFGLAVTQLVAARRELITGFFTAVADAMLVVIGWVLWIAPLGVFALALVVGARSGLAGAGALGHYVVVVSMVGVIVTLLAYPLAVFGARWRLDRFAQAAVPPQAVAISTQSSLACLPPMLRAAERLGVSDSLSGIVLPMAVALFRCTGPAMNLAVALYVAHWFGVELSGAQIAAGIALAATTTLGAVSLPGQVSFVSSIGPIAVALGLPVEPLLLLVAVETIPDIFRTLGNVTADVALTGTVARVSRERGEGRAVQLGEVRP